MLLRRDDHDGLALREPRLEEGRYRSGQEIVLVVELDGVIVGRKAPGRQVGSGAGPGHGCHFSTWGQLAGFAREPNP